MPPFFADTACLCRVALARHIIHWNHKRVDAQHAGSCVACNICAPCRKGPWDVECILAVIGTGGPVKRSNIICALCIVGSGERPPGALRRRALHRWTTCFQRQPSCGGPGRAKWRTSGRRRGGDIRRGA
eukprot:4212941-Pyramimonas_sp.AAC.1